MVVITTHMNADFDCLASMAAACRLYPEAVVIFPGSQEKNVRLFLEKVDHHLPIRRLRNFDMSSVNKLVIVDTVSRERIGPFAPLCDNPDVELEIYDHHPKSVGDIKFVNGVLRQRGANSTLMVEILQEKGIEPTPEEATLLMLGIYEDTGSLTFTSTCSEDFRAAEYLHSIGANLNIVSEYIQRKFNSLQVAMLHDLLDRLEYRNINGIEVAIAFANVEQYIGDLSSVIHTLKDMENLTALFVIVEMDGRLHLVARSNIDAIDASHVSARFGGGGHKTAASATIKNMLMKDAQKILIEELEKEIPPAPTAGEMMVTPVITTNESETLERVEELLTRHNINTMPVLKNRKVSGLITRQVVEKAIFHNLGGSKVADYMQTEFSSIQSDATYETVQDIVIRLRQKIVPVTDNDDKLIGIVGRLDAIRAIYSDFMKSPSSMLHPDRKVSRQIKRSVTNLMREQLPADIIRLLDRVSVCAAELGFTAYVVGGFVRDLLMRKKNYDIDIVIEGDGIEFANRFVEKHGGRVKEHKKFKTAIMAIGKGKKVDVATARTEYYPEPAALPIVEMSSIKNDLFRRDFTINSLAIKLDGKDHNAVIDFFGGQQDMKDGVLRVLHNLSFVEDPTRVFRAIRFSERFHFSLGAQTENLLKLAVKKELVDKISGNRLLGELQNIFREEHLERATKRISKLKLWRFIHPSIKYDNFTHNLIEHSKEAINWHQLTFPDEKLRFWLVYLYALSAKLNRKESAEFFRRLGFSEHPIRKYVDQKSQAWDIFNRFANLSLKRPVEIYESFSGLETETLLLLMSSASKREHKRIVADYMTRIRGVVSKVNGKDLSKVGIETGPIMGKVLEAIKVENLKDSLPKIKDEIEFAKKIYPILLENLAKSVPPTVKR